MTRCCVLVATLAALVVSTHASAQLKQERVELELQLKRLKPLKAEKGPMALDSFRGRYRYRVAALRRMLVLQKHLPRCMETQRLVSGEFTDRLDFVITPDGKLERFASRRRRQQLHGCLLPHTLGLRFPAFSKHKRFTVHLLVGSAGARLGRRVEATPAPAVYPITSPQQMKVYKRAVYWAMSPWSSAISACGEWVDQTMSFGYRFALSVGISAKGKLVQPRLEAKGKLVDKAANLFSRCAAPFLRRVRLPRHDGEQPVPYRLGTSTAGWGIR